jgi:hypothetical protein
MLPLFKKMRNIAGFDRVVLKKNNISLLILDERWSSLFKNFSKPKAIRAREQKLKSLIKKQAVLTAEQKKDAQIKKNSMDMIIKLASSANDGNEKAMGKISLCENEIKRVNKRAGDIERELGNTADLIQKTNIELLETTVSIVYIKIRRNRKRREELDKIIEQTREKLRGYIDEREQLAEDDTDVYSYFHDLLGAEEIEKLDLQFFKPLN